LLDRVAVFVAADGGQGRDSRMTCRSGSAIAGRETLQRVGGLRDAPHGREADGRRLQAAILGGHFAIDKFGNRSQVAARLDFACDGSVEQELGDAPASFRREPVRLGLLMVFEGD
jgi:hypothetical protein